jgi:hypothetical protein
MTLRTYCPEDYVEIFAYPPTRYVPTVVVDFQESDVIFPPTSRPPPANSTQPAPILRSMGRFCGNTPPPAMSALGMMSIRFVTANESSDRGWVASYQIARKTISCCYVCL